MFKTLKSVQKRTQSLASLSRGNQLQNVLLCQSKFIIKRKQNESSVITTIVCTL